MNKKKVLICVPALDVGGAEKFAVDLALHIDKTKFDVRVAQTRRNSNSFLVDVLKENNIEIVDLSGSNYLSMLKKQLAYFNKEKIDVVHTQIGSLLHVMWACKLKNIKTRIYTLHNEASLFYGENKIMKKVFRSAFTHYGFKAIAISKTIKESMMNYLDIKDVVVINNGVDTNVFKPAKKEDSSTIRIISVGSLYWIKNQEMMIKAVNRIHEVNSNVDLTLLGDGEDKEKLEELIDDLKANDYIHLLGRKQDVVSYLQASDIYISASKTEGLPLSIAEAMACGLPIVATKAGGVIDLVEENENGYLVNIDDLEGFIDRLNKLINDKKLRKEFSKKTLELVQDWTIEKCVNGYENLYQD